MACLASAGSGCKADDVIELKFCGDLLPESQVGQPAIAVIGQGTTMPDSDWLRLSAQIVDLEQWCIMG
jgi:hypothetical protein